MELKLYVVDIRELENTDFCSQALRLLDPARKEKAIRARKEKDRARLTGAGLLLLLAHAGIPGSLDLTDETVSVKKDPSAAGRMRAEKEDGDKGIVSDERLQILSPALIIQTIADEEEKRGYPLSEGIFYKITDRGKPSWKQPAYPYFSISHSGDYAALAAADVPVGIDIQEPRKVLHQAIGDYRKFSRMESYFKCTGRGIDTKIDACYREAEEAERSGRYVFRDIPMPEEYALWVCTEVRHPGSRL